MLPDQPVVMANVGWPDDPAGAGGRADGTGHDAALTAVRTAVADGARLVDLGPASGAAVSSVHAIDPDVLVCADAPGADLTRDPELARRTGAALLRTRPASAHSEGAHRGGGHGSADGPALVAAAPADVGWLTAAGWAVLVDADAAELAATLAVASVCAWLGARIVRTRHVAAVRQAIEMVESIRGTRAPLRTRRGLA